MVWSIMFFFTFFNDVIMYMVTITLNYKSNIAKGTTDPGVDYFDQ